MCAIGIVIWPDRIWMAGIVCVVLWMCINMNAIHFVVALEVVAWLDIVLISGFVCVALDVVMRQERIWIAQLGCVVLDVIFWQDKIWMPWLVCVAMEIAHLQCRRWMSGLLYWIRSYNLPRQNMDDTACWCCILTRYKCQCLFSLRWRMYFDKTWYGWHGLFILLLI
jgi:hypothetical protein